MTDPLPLPLCATCRFNVLHHYLLADKPTEGRQCSRHFSTYPNAKDCDRYEREPGTEP